MSNDNDPRVYFAAERTLLAWLRTGLAVIGLGFVVARFGLFLSLLRNQPPPAALGGSSIIGITLVLLGALAVGVSAWQHLRFSRSLSPAERPRRYWMSLAVLFAFTLALLGVVLGAYLVVGPPHS